MKSIKYLVVFALAVIFSVSSCTKDNSIIDITDPNPVTPKETSSNPLLNRGVVSEEGFSMACFTVQYPFELSVNGTNVSISSDDDMVGVFENLDSTSFIDFVYPIEITYDDSGETETIEDGEALGEAFAKCIPDDGWGDTEFPAFIIDESNSCFTLNYPIKLSDGGSTVYDVADESVFVNLMAEHEVLFFVFPITLTKVETQETFEVADNDALFDLLMSCEPMNLDSLFDVGNSGVLVACYTLDFPVNYIDANGDVATAADLDELNEAFLSSNVVNFTFPMHLVTYEGVSKTVNSEEELNQAIDADCPEFGHGEFLDTDLLAVYAISIAGNSFDLVYPITITSDGGATTSELQNEDDLKDELANGVDSDIVFPFTLFDIASGANKVFNSLDELYDYIGQL